MDIRDAKKLVKDIKIAIQYANDHQDYKRVKYLQIKRTQLKKKIRNFEWARLS